MDDSENRYEFDLYASDDDEKYEDQQDTGEQPTIDNPEDVPIEHILDMQRQANAADEDSLQDYLNAYHVLKEKAEMEGAGSNGQGYGDLDFLDNFVHNGHVLSLRQKVLVAAFLIDLNAVRALRVAGYNVDTHCSQIVVTTHMNKPIIQAAIKHAMARRMERLRINADNVLIEIGKLAFANMGEYADWGAHGVMLKDSDLISNNAKAAVQEISETQSPNGTRNVKLRLHDKGKALNDLGRHLGLFRDRLEVSDTSDAEQKLSRARERALNARKNKQGVYEADNGENNS